MKSQGTLDYEHQSAFVHRSGKIACRVAVTVLVLVFGLPAVLTNVNWPVQWMNEPIGWLAQVSFSLVILAIVWLVTVEIAYWRYNAKKTKQTQ